MRWPYDILEYSERQDISELLLLLDFEKAFDSVEWNFVGIALQSFNTGGILRKWIRVCYTDYKSRVISNDNMSPFFSVPLSCRQVDPVSPYFFLLICEELLSMAMKKNTNIKGIPIEGLNSFVCLCADDLSVILDGKPESLTELFSMSSHFSESSVLHISFEKTKSVWVGSKRESSEIICPHRKLDRTPRDFGILGITYTTDLNSIPLI